jgi:NADH-quinone oxidoreductase subunit C
MPERFAVVYNLYSIKDNVRTRVKAWVPEAIRHRSVSRSGAPPWAEREVWDLMGIKFKGHPDLKRIQLPRTTKAIRCEGLSAHRRGER